MTTKPKVIEPEPLSLADGEAIIADGAEFFALTNSIAAIVRDGALYALRRESMKWVNVESLTHKPASVAAIKKAPQ